MPTLEKLSISFWHIVSLKIANITEPDFEISYAYGKNMYVSRGTFKYHMTPKEGVCLNRQSTVI